MTRARASGLIIIGILLLVLPVIPTQGYIAVPVEIPQRDYWPTNEWRNSTPEEQGLNSEVLDRIDRDITEQDIEIDSVVVIKNGYLVYEKYYGYWSQYMLHTLQSCTKSFMSALIGIAIDMGFIDNVSQRVIDFFPNYMIDNMDSWKENITLFHLLTMSSGMEFHEVDIPYTDPANDLFEMYRRDDMWHYVLNRSMLREPGIQWEYNSGGIELLGGIIEQTTGYSVADFAEEFLFNPIGIESFMWWRPPASRQYGCGGGLYLKPRDMARFGYLYLNEGNWNGTQVISSEWISESTPAYYDTGGWYHYGYTWWSVPEQGFYEATGHYEQKIFVIPEQDIVVAFTGDIADEDWHPTDYFVMEYVIQAVAGSSGGMLPFLMLSICVIVAVPLSIFIFRLRFR